MLRKLASQTAIYGISTILARLLNYLLTPLFTYKAFSEEEFGSFNLVYAIIPLALIILTMGMESGYFRFAGKAESEDEKKTVFSTTWGSVSYLSILFLSVILLFAEPIALYLRLDRSVIYMAAFIIALDAITAIPFARLRQEGKALRFVIIRTISILINVLLCLFFYLAVLKWESLNWAVISSFPKEGYALLSNLIASSVTFILLTISIKDLSLKVNFKLFKEILAYSLPLLISGLAGMANEVIDRFAIDNLLPAEISRQELGIYSATVKIGALMMLFVQMYRFAAEPFFLASFKKEDFQKASADAMKYSVIISVLIFLGIMLYLDIFKLLVGEEFRGGIYMLPVILLANIFAGMILNLSFWYKQSGKTKFAIIITLSGFVIVFLANIILVPMLGSFGAAIARLICEFSMVAISLYLCKKHYPIPYDIPRILEYMLVGGLIYFISLGTQDLSAILKYPINTLLIFIFIVWAVKREKIDIFALVKSVKK